MSSGDSHSVVLLASPGMMENLTGRKSQTSSQLHTKRSVIQNLQLIVLENEKDVKKGVVPLCLTPEVLLILNHGFEHLTDTRLSDQKLAKDLNYLQQAFNFTKYLRLSHGGNSTIQAPVDLSTFHALTQLDVKKIPPHWIRGLDKFKDKLTLIRMSRSINFLEDLLGKSADPHQISVVWNNLRNLYISNNFIRELDDSLKLLPSLEVLDLSQNYLTQTDNKLQYLNELEHINLAYNSLCAVPSFSPLAYSRIRTLVLRANHLEHLSGVEVLENLETLDLTTNILCDHGVLHSLSRLTSLCQLYLDENPLSFNRNHRSLTGANLHTQVMEKLSLDGQSLTEAEIREASELRTRILTPPQSPVTDRPQSILSEQASESVAPGQSAGRPRLRSNVVNDITEIPQPSDDVDSLMAAGIDVEDNVLSDDTEVLSKNGSPPVCGAAPARHKTRIETLREEFGDSWLQSYAPINKQVSPSDPAEGTQPVTSTEEVVSAETGDDIDVSSPHSPYGSVIDEDNDISILDGSDSKYNSIEEISSTSETVGVISPADDTSALSHSSHSSSKGDKSDNSSTFSVDELDEDDTEMEEVEPFVVKRPTEDSEEFWLSISKTQVIEKDIEGRITEMLDLSALRNIQLSSQDGHSMVSCKFDYFRKDRRERCYVMEDESYSMRLMDILQPIVDKSLSEMKTTDTMECLKCSKRFEVPKHGKRSSRAECIHCHSDMVIELSSALNSQSTPYGSVSSDSSPPNITKPLRTRASQIKLSDESTTFSDSYTSAISDLPPTTVYTQDLSSQDPRLRSGTDATDSTIDGAEGTVEDIVDSPTKEEATEKTEYIAIAVENRVRSNSVTPDTLSYQSLESASLSPGSPVGGEEVHHDKDTFTGFRFDWSDLSYIDHRLKLHLTMTYFSDDEETQCVVRCKCVEYTKPEEYAAVIVMTNAKFYIFRIQPIISKRLDVGPQLELSYKDSLSDIHYVEIGLDHQNIRVEFEKTGYCILLRDMNLGRQVHAKLSMMMSEASFNEVSKLKSITKIHQEYYNHIAKCLPDISRTVDLEKITATYCAAYKLTHDEFNVDILQGCQAVSLVVDENNVYILREMYHLPFTRNRLSKKQTYFNHENTIPIGDIANLHVDRIRHQVDIEGFEEQSLEFIHKFAFASSSSAQNFIALLKEPWKSLYDVDLQINYSN